MRARKLVILTLIIVALLSGACAPIDKYRATVPELRATLLLANLSPQSDLDKLTPQQVRAKGNRLLMLLKGKPLTDALIAEAAEIAATEVSPIDDVRADRQYRLDIVSYLVRDGLTKLR